MWSIVWEGSLRRRPRETGCFTVEMSSFLVSRDVGAIAVLTRPVTAPSLVGLLYVAR